jgi:hypothetical protein
MIRFSLIETEIVCLLRVDGATEVLAQDAALTYAPGRTYRIEIEARGDRLGVAIDGTPVLSAQDGALAAGTLALYSAANQGSRFGDVLVEAVSP